jgi:hypothetical protein
VNSGRSFLPSSVYPAVLDDLAVNEDWPGSGATEDVVPRGRLDRPIEIAPVSSSSSLNHLSGPPLADVRGRRGR